MTPWLQDLRRQLDRTIAGEMEVTVQIAVMLAAKCTKTQIIHTLGCTDTDIKMATQRLQGVAIEWKE